MKAKVNPERWNGNLAQVVQFRGPTADRALVESTLPTNLGEPAREAHDQSLLAEPILGNSEIPEPRTTADRRVEERRHGPRRDREIRAANEKRNFGRIGTLCAALGATIGVLALAFAPVVAQSTPCSDSLGGEMLHRREMHPIWVAAVVLCVLAIALPSRPRRSYLSVGLVGLTAGLLVAAAIRVATWRTGVCFN